MAMDLRDAIRELEIAAEYRMILWEFNQWMVWKNPGDFTPKGCIDGVSAARRPIIVDQQGPTLLQVLS